MEDEEANNLQLIWTDILASAGGNLDDAITVVQLMIEQGSLKN